MKVYIHILTYYFYISLEEFFLSSRELGTLSFDGNKLSTDEIPTARLPMKFQKFYILALRAVTYLSTFVYYSGMRVFSCFRIKYTETEN